MKLDQVLADLRKLNQPVPKPMRLPTAEEVSAVEKRLGITFHPDNRKYLLEASDVVHGTLEPCTITLPGADTDLAAIADSAWKEWGIPRELLPICEDNADYYCMNANGEVIFWSHNGLTDEKWPNLATWIRRVWIEQG
jgi:hypothetical protein